MATEPNWAYQKRYEEWLRTQGMTPEEQTADIRMEAFQARFAGESNWAYQKRYEAYLRAKAATPAVTAYGGGGGYSGGGGGYSGGGGGYGRGNRISQYIPQVGYGSAASRPTYANMPDTQGWLYGLVTWSIGK